MMADLRVTTISGADTVLAQVTIAACTQRLHGHPSPPTMRVMPRPAKSQQENTTPSPVGVRMRSFTKSTSPRRTRC